MPNCVLLVGLPCSGKTTYVRNHAEYCDNRKYTILSSDDILEEMAQALGGTYNDLWEDYYFWADFVFWDLFDKAIANKENIVVDRTSLTINTRKRLLNRLTPDYKKCAVDFKPNPAVTNSRNVRPGKVIPKEVLWSMLCAYQMPSFDEGFDFIEQRTV